MEFSYEVHYRTGIPLLKSDEQLLETLEHNQVRWIFLLRVVFLLSYNFRLLPNVSIHLFLGHLLASGSRHGTMWDRKVQALVLRELALEWEMDRRAPGGLRREREAL